MAPEEKLKDPLVLLGLGSIFLPFIMILGFQATGVILCGNQIYGAFVLNRRVDLHAIDATPVRWRGDAGSSPLDRASAATPSRTDLGKSTRHTG